MTSEYLSLASEIRELEGLLSNLPQSSVIERMSLKTRLASVKAELESASDQVAARAKLTFRGRPVYGSHGIAAEFGSKAAGAFTDAFSAIAAGLTEGLRYMGPIPNKEKNQLLITGTAIGSFGFEFELPVPEPNLFPEESNTHAAMMRIEELFRLAAQGSDDEVSEVIAEVHPRAVRKVSEFLDLLVQQHAWCGLEFGERSFKFANYEQLKASNERLKEDNIQEREEIHSGQFIGVLPTGRTFEFRLSDRGELIRGKVDLAVDDPDRLNQEWLYKSVEAKFNVMQVGQGRPRYTLMNLGDINLSA